MEEWKVFLSWLNECAGLFALLALVAAIAMPLFIFWLQKRNDRKAMKDEYDARKDLEQFPMNVEDRNDFVRKQLLAKWLKK